MKISLSPQPHVSGPLLTKAPFLLQHQSRANESHLRTRPLLAGRKPVQTARYPPRAVEMDPEGLELNSRSRSPHFRRDLIRRMEITAGTKKEMEQAKRDRRQWVLEECLKRGMDLRCSFNTWPYKTRMYPAIKAITAAALEDWRWDRVTTRDVIRTLCWDRVRSYNRRNKSIDDRAKQPKKATTREDIPVKAPKTLTRTKIPHVPVQEAARPTNKQTRSVGKVIFPDCVFHIF